MNEHEQVIYELGFRAGVIQGLLDSIERKLDLMIDDAKPTPEPTAPTAPTPWWKRRPIWW